MQQGSGIGGVPCGSLRVSLPLPTASTAHLAGRDAAVLYLVLHIRRHSPLSCRIFFTLYTGTRGQVDLNIRTLCSSYSRYTVVIFPS